MSFAKCLLMLACAVLFSAGLASAIDSAPKASVRRGVLVDSVDSAENVTPGDTARLEQKNIYLLDLPVALWIHPGLGFSTNGYAATLALSFSARSGFYFSIQGTTSGNLHILSPDAEYATSAALLTGYRMPRSDMFASFGLGPVFGDGESSHRTGKKADCGFVSIGCDGNEYTIQEHRGLGFMVQGQMGTSNRFIGATALLQWIHFDGLSTFGFLFGFPVGALF